MCTVVFWIVAQIIKLWSKLLFQHGSSCMSPLRLRLTFFYVSLVFGKRLICLDIFVKAFLMFIYLQLRFGDAFFVCLEKRVFHF